MKIECAPSEHAFSGTADLDVVLYGLPTSTRQGWIGACLEGPIKRLKIVPTTFAWDFLSLALSVMSADQASYKERSPDGWTREFELSVSVVEPERWNQLKPTIENALCFLTTDKWNLSFTDGGYRPTLTPNMLAPDEDSVVLLSGGLDSLVGAIDITTTGKLPYLVSQVPTEGKKQQVKIKDSINSELKHLQLNYIAKIPNAERPPKQRARSIIFLAYGIIAASNISVHHPGTKIPLFVCENGFISINPPLTENRIGSLSTRTTHPIFISLIQKILDDANANIQIVNPYKYKTKGEMLTECSNQAILKDLASDTVSCGKYGRWGHRHCGRCVPCLVRRAAFHFWGETDHTIYACDNLALAEHENSEDVRSMLMAIRKMELYGVDRLLGASLSSPLVTEVSDLKNTASRGFTEIKHFLSQYNII